MNRWAREHERAFLSMFLGVGVLVLGLMTVDAAREHGPALIAAAWASGFAAVAAASAVRHRAGRLILRRAADRERQRERNARSTPLTLALLALFAVLAIVSEVAWDVGVAALSGAFTALAPMLLWIAFVLRPDRHPGQDL